MMAPHEESEPFLLDDGSTSSGRPQPAGRASFKQGLFLKSNGIIYVLNMSMLILNIILLLKGKHANTACLNNRPDDWDMELAFCKASRQPNTYYN